jgi:hypothetical protein
VDFGRRAYRVTKEAAAIFAFTQTIREFFQEFLNRHF